MADQLQCSGCSARFRVRLSPDAPRRAELACPRCGAAMVLERPSKVAERGDTKSSPTPTPSPDRRTGWRPLSTSEVFGRPTPPPPAPASKPRPTTEPAPSDRPTLGLFEPGGNDEPRGTPRLPEADRRDGGRPLASALLRELKQRRKGTFAVQTASTSQPVETTATGTDSAATGDNSEENIDFDVDTDEWFDDDLIERAVDAASEELLIVDETPMESQRIRGADLGDDGDARGDATADPIAPSTVDPPDATATEAPSTKPPARPERTPVPESEPEPEPGDETVTTPAPPPVPSDKEGKAPKPEPSVELPLTISAPRSTESSTDALSLEDVEATATTYRLRIGGKAYGDIDFDDLITLFRRGIWVVADEIAEDDGPWMPIEKHPIFERVRDVIAQSVTNLLLTHARLLDESPDRDENDTPSDAPAPQIESVEVTDDVDPDPVPTVRPASNTLPWTIALVATGVASATVAGVTGAAIAYAYFAEPTALISDDKDDAEPAISAPAIIDDSHPISTQKLRQKQSEAVDEATRIVEDAAHPDGLELAERALDRGAHEAARHLAAHHAAQSAEPDAARHIFERAVSEDPLLRQKLRTMNADNSVDDLRALGGGRSITLRFTEDGADRYAYKVAREDWEEGWRAEIAAYKLSKLLPTDLYVPFNEPTRISRDDFDELYGRVNTPRQHAYAEDRFDELHWVEEPGPDGVERDYLYGTLKEWIPEYTTWPIEYVDTWRPWLDPASDVDFDDDAEDYLERLAERNNRAASSLKSHVEDQAKGELAKQVSNLHVFDFLMNNFDRYSGVEDYYGVNAHFAHGRFVPIDNSAGFQFRDRPELNLVDRRLEPVGRFSRSLIEAIRMLRPDFVDPILFPEPTAEEQQRLDFFWHQRQKLLDHVDALVDEYGEDAVYAFD